MLTQTAERQELLRVIHTLPDDSVPAVLDFAKGYCQHIPMIGKGMDKNSLYLLAPDTSKTPVLGRLNGIIEIPDDFDEPLDEMKEYMY